MSNKTILERLNTSMNVNEVPRGYKYWEKILIDKCGRLFMYKNLPSTLPAWEIEKSLIIKGFATIVYVPKRLGTDGGIYVPFESSVYGYDAYMVPNRCTYANPVLGTGQLQDGKDCVIIYNTDVDKNIPGSTLMETIKRYARMLADLESTFNSLLVADRASLLGQAQNSNVADAVNNIIRKIKLGETDTVVNPSMMLDSFKPLTFNQSKSSLSELSQARDYLLNCFYNEIGLQTLEEKKERMISSELEVDNDVLNNNITSMLANRKKGIDRANEVFIDYLDDLIEVEPSVLLGGA